MADTTYAFISYAHQDFIIADEIRNQLVGLAQRGMGGTCLECFLDTESIEPGQKYEPVIRKALERTDWLIVVFTGDQSVYCGFEIGLYSFMNDDSKPQEEKPVVCLHDVDRTKLPAVVAAYSTTQISRVAPYLPDNAAASSPDVKFWWDSPARQAAAGHLPKQESVHADPSQTGPGPVRTRYRQGSQQDRLCLRSRAPGGRRVGNAGHARPRARRLSPVRQHAEAHPGKLHAGRIEPGLRAARHQSAAVARPGTGAGAADHLGSVCGRRWPGRNAPTSPGSTSSRPISPAPPR